jgi:hypothetical protein
VNEKTGFRKVALLIATMLWAIMLAATSIPSLSPATAFAQHVEPVDNLLGQLNVDPNNDGNLVENIVEDKSVTVDPTIQVSTQTATNVNNDNDVAFLEGCADISDDDVVTQTNRQAANQVVHKDSEVGDGGLVVEPTIQVSTQTATNVNNDNDVYIVLGCDDDDDSNLEISDDDVVTQTNRQAANQVVHKDSEVGGLVVNPHIQRSAQTATNVNNDNDVYIVLGGDDDDDSNLEISDDDKVTQLNEQIANQVVHKDSEVGDGGLVVNPHIQRSAQTATNYNEDNDRVVLV